MTRSRFLLPCTVVLLVVALAVVAITASSQTVAPPSTASGAPSVDDSSFPPVAATQPEQARDSARQKLWAQIDQAITQNNGDLADALFQQYRRFYPDDNGALLSYHLYARRMATKQLEDRDFRKGLDLLLQAFSLAEQALATSNDASLTARVVVLRKETKGELRDADQNWRQQVIDAHWKHICKADELWRDSRGWFYDDKDMQREAVRILAQAAPDVEVMSKDQAEKFWEVAQRLKDGLGEREFQSLSDKAKVTDKIRPLFPEPRDRPWDSVTR